MNIKRHLKSWKGVLALITGVLIAITAWLGIKPLTVDEVLGGEDASTDELQPETPRRDERE